jgi:hypothetical protein
MGKVHGSLARAGKVKSQTPKVEKQESAYHGALPLDCRKIWEETKRGGSYGKEWKADLDSPLSVALFAGNSQLGRTLLDLATFVLL